MHYFDSRALLFRGQIVTKHLTAQDLAERWSKSAEWVTQQARRGQIPGAWKLGRHWRFDLQEIETYEQAQRTEVDPSVLNQGSDSIFALTPLSRKRQQNKKNHYK